MRVVVLAATKGGVGKTTLASALAVRAAQESKRVALIDADPTASLERWWELRGEPDNPRILGVDCSAEALGLLISERWQWVFIDTPPALIDEIAQAILVADFVLIPTRASAIDVEAMDHVIELCKERRKPFAFVLNAVQPTWKLTESAAAYLERDGKVLEPRICYRKAYISAMTSGRSAPEVEKDGQAAKEIDALWASVKKFVVRSARAR